MLDKDCKRCKMGDINKQHRYCTRAPKLADRHGLNGTFTLFNNLDDTTGPLKGTSENLMHMGGLVEVQRLG